jgi:hypothetical protein
MGIIGLVISLISVLFLVIGLIPLLGWLNWFTTLPIAVLGIIISSIAMARPRNQLAMAGLIINLTVIVIALVRLAIGGGII